jgi:hypothetical protein
MSRSGLFRVGSRFSVAALLAVGMVACGADNRRPEPGSPTATAAATRPAGDPAAGRVALAYMRAIMRNDYDAALPLVASDQREMLKALALGQGPGTLPTLRADLTVGEVAVSGNRATVSFVGRMCRTEARRRGSKPKTDCIENEDAKTASPVFRIRLVQEAGWKVAFEAGGG